MAEKFTLENTCLKKGCLDGEVAVVTGSTSNVGLGYAEALAWAGAKVVIVGRNEKRGAEIVAKINSDNDGDVAIFVKTDVTEAKDIENLYQKSIEKFGKVDILINNAMDLSLNGPVLGSKIEDLERSYAISGRGVMLAVNAFVPDMIKRGHGVVAYSTTQFMWLPGMLGGAMYTAGKACATSLMMSLANEVTGTGVNVFCLAPAGVGQINPDSVKEITDEMKAMAMPGFNGLIPREAAGAGLVYTILHSDEMHNTGINMSDALIAMDYPFPKPETIIKRDMHYLGGFPLTLAFLYMGHGFPEK